MDFIASLILAAEVFREATGLERTTVSWRLFGDSKKLDALIAGSDIQVRRYEKALAWLSGNWPEDVNWPECVVRPHVDGPPSSVDAVVAPPIDPGAEKSLTIFSPAGGAA